MVYFNMILIVTLPRRWFSMMFAFAINTIIIYFSYKNDTTIIKTEKATGKTAYKECVTHGKIPMYRISEASK